MNISYIASSGRIYPLTAASIKIKEAKFHAWEFKPEGTELRLIAVDEHMSNIRKQAEEQGASERTATCPRFQAHLSEPRPQADEDESGARPRVLSAPSLRNPAKTKTRV